MTEGGVRAYWKEVRRRERSVMGCGMGRVVRWGRRAASRYAQARTGKGDLGSWCSFIGSDDEQFLCRLYGGVLETDDHLAFGCHVGRALGCVWESWEECDDPEIWRVVEDGKGGEKVWDRAEVFFNALDRSLRGELDVG